MIFADLRKEDYESAKKHWNELCDGMHNRVDRGRKGRKVLAVD